MICLLIGCSRWAIVHQFNSQDLLAVALAQHLSRAAVDELNQSQAAQDELNQQVGSPGFLGLN